MKHLLIITLSLMLVSPAMAVSCKSFANQAAAQAYFNAKKAGYKRLDRDHDGFACDCNKGGGGKKCPKHKRHKR